MPDTQTMLDRGYTTSEIRRMCANQRAISPSLRTGFMPDSLLAARVPVLDGCNHSR